MKNVSTAGVGMYSAVLILVAKFVFGVDVDEGMATETVLAIMGFVAFCTWFWGQINRKDLVLGLIRK